MKVLSKSYIGLAAALALTIIVFLPSMSNDFVDWDDPLYIHENILIQEFSIDQLTRIFNTPYLANYQPLTLISYAIDFAIGEYDARIYHLHNLLLHLLNVALVFFLIQMLFKDRAMAFFCAILFGIHPMHAESVAWVSGRKDVLYVFYFVLGMVFYLKHLSNSNKKLAWYGLALFSFVLSCLAKGQAVVFPAILILLLLFKRQLTATDLFKTAPFFAIGLLFGLLAMRFQAEAGATDTSPVTGWHRLFVACYTTTVYVLKSIVPFQLSAFHPYPELPGGKLPWWMYASIIPIVLLIFWWLRSFREDRVVFFGLGFFFISILLVSQIIPVGRSIISDRYSYLSYLGLFIVIAQWLRSSYARYGKPINMTLRVMAVGYLVSLSAVTYGRCSVWKNSETLWSDVTHKYPEHFMAYSNLGKHYWDHGNKPLAEQAFRDCAERSKQRPECANNLGLFLKNEGRNEEALEALNRAVKTDSTYYPALLNRGVLLSEMGRNAEALRDMNAMVRVNPDTLLSYLFRAIVLERSERYADAISDYHVLIQREPNNASFYDSRGLVHFKNGNLQAALRDYDKALDINPDFGEAYYRRSKLLAVQGNLQAAKADMNQALRLNYPVPPAFIVQLNSATE